MTRDKKNIVQTTYGGPWYLVVMLLEGTLRPNTLFCFISCIYIVIKVQMPPVLLEDVSWEGHLDIPLIWFLFASIHPCYLRERPDCYFHKLLFFFSYLSSIIIGVVNNAMTSLFILRQLKVVLNRTVTNTWTCITVKIHSNVMKANLFYFFFKNIIQLKSVSVFLTIIDMVKRRSYWMVDVLIYH